MASRVNMRDISPLVVTAETAESSMVVFIKAPDGETYSKGPESVEGNSLRFEIPVGHTFVGFGYAE